jgi:hypothetical protein
MVKFEFTLSDVDAENLIGILHNEQVRCLDRGRGFIKRDMSPSDTANLEWYNAHADYLEGLKKKIAAGSTRVESVL